MSSKSFYSPPSSTEIEADICVVGAGTAGVAAAVSAARAGATVVLLERGNSFGGMGAAAFVHTLCGLYLVQNEAEPVFANQGFAMEFAQSLIKRNGAAQAPMRMGRLDVLFHEPAALARLASDLILEQPSLQAYCQVELNAASIGNDCLDSLEFRMGTQTFTLKARQFIDTTGDAALTFLAGGAFAQVEPARLQRPAWIVALAGLPPQALTDAIRLRLAHTLAQAVKAGNLPPSALGCSFRPGIHPDNGWMTIDLAGDDGDGSKWNPVCPQTLEVLKEQGVLLAEAIVGFVQEQMAWPELRIAAHPERPGIRESRRIKGVYELTGEDILSARRFADGIASATWPIELREKPTGPRWRFPEGCEPPQIPLRALRHRDLQNLWVAGRCLSCDHEAQAAIRVMGTCLATGEAAGLAAAFTVQGEEDFTTIAQRIRDFRLTKKDGTHSTLRQDG